jgi:probable rRNA maturation factor
MTSVAPAQYRDTPVVDIVVKSDQWVAQPASAGTAAQAIAEAARWLPACAEPSELAVVLSDDSAVQALNRRWRGIDKPTNVLSFPAGAAAAGLLGDIVIAYETTAREATRENKPFTDHLAHLVVHGFLHLLGYDHESDTEAAAMERLERRILAQLHVPDPYADATSDVDPHG